jgi:hypothetical protein
MFERAGQQSSEPLLSSSLGVMSVSIIRIGLAETKNFSEGYDAIFGKKKDKGAQAKKDESSGKKKGGKKKKGKKKK